MAGEVWAAAVLVAAAMVAAAMAAEEMAAEEREVRRRSRSFQPSTPLRRQLSSCSTTSCCLRADTSPTSACAATQWHSRRLSGPSSSKYIVRIPQSG